VYPLLVLRLRALIARARGDAADYHDFVERYRAQAESLGLDGHIATAAAM
jgi:adenylate cyclase